MVALSEVIFLNVGLFTTMMLAIVFGPFLFSSRILQTHVYPIYSVNSLFQARYVSNTAPLEKKCLRFCSHLNLLILAMLSFPDVCYCLWQKIGHAALKTV